jgi:putative methionine-R-sulfoxide reductase with GAF domain
VFYPPLTVYPIFCIVLSFAAIGLNHLHWHRLSRFILSTLVLLLAYVYHGFLVQPGEDFITSMFIIEFALSVIPWVLIDFREKTLLIVSLSACYLMIFSQSWVNEVLDIELDSSLFRVGLLSNISFIFGVMILVSCLIFMQVKNHKSEDDNERLLADIHEKSEKMEQQQKELHDRLEEIRRSREQEERQNWVAKGIADISEILRQDDDKIYTDLLRAIIKYLDANQGGIYLVAEDEMEEKFFELVACYAYEKEKFLTKRIEIGQGLLGQAYLEKETVVLKEVPEDYITITSGLGDAPPTVIVIVPLLHEEKVTGVMEIALFHQLDDYQLDFLNKAGTNIASFVSSNSLNVQTRNLLEKSQEQMEQLKLHEEEMRQNMEELQATQEEMHRKEQEYLRRIALLEDKQPEK